MKQTQHNIQILLEFFLPCIDSEKLAKAVSFFLAVEIAVETKLPFYRENEECKMIT